MGISLFGFLFVRHHSTRPCFFSSPTMVASDLPLRPGVQTQFHGWGIEGGPADVGVGQCWSMLCITWKLGGPWCPCDSVTCFTWQGQQIAHPWSKAWRWSPWYHWYYVQVVKLWLLPRSILPAIRMILDEYWMLFGYPLEWAMIS